MRDWIGIKDPLPTNLAGNVNEIECLWHLARASFEQAYVCALSIIEILLQARLVTPDDYDAAIQFIEGAHIVTGVWEATPFWRPTYSDLSDWRIRHGSSDLIVRATYGVMDNRLDVTGRLASPEWVETRDELRDLLQKIPLWSDAHHETNVALAISVLSINPGLYGCRDVRMLEDSIARVVAERRLGYFKPNIHVVALLIGQREGPIVMQRPAPSYNNRSSKGLERFVGADGPRDADKSAL